MVLNISISVILLCLLLIYNNISKTKNVLYLCASLIFMCLIAILHHFAVLEPNSFWIAVLAGHTIPLAFLTGPFLYFYTRNSLQGNTPFKRQDLIHFLPFVVSFISIFPYYFADFSVKLNLAQQIVENENAILAKVNFSWLYPSFYNILLRPFFLLGYTLASLALINRYIKKKKISLRLKGGETILKWLLLIDSMMFLIGLTYSGLTINFFANFITNREQINQSPFSYLLYILLCLIPLLILFFPEILYDVKKNKKGKTATNPVSKENHDDLVEKATRVVNFIKTKENLLNSSLRVSDISQALNLSVQEINYCIQVVLQTKFSSLKNELRVELAKEELANGNLLSHSMEGIWIKAGFTSKTSFFVTFKEVTGMTPLEYVKQLNQAPKA